ncbi:MAG: amino acid permease, partial [Actinomycetes bacterium]
MTARVVGLPGATAIGAGAMLGAGVFAVWGPAAAQAGSLLVVAVVLAGVAAMLNAGSTAQLAAVYPVAGGAYAYGRAELGAWPGFVAGIGFVVGKTA